MKNSRPVHYYGLAHGAPQVLMAKNYHAEPIVFNIDGRIDAELRGVQNKTVAEYSAGLCI
jgi:hypothetical protein